MNRYIRLDENNKVISVRHGKEMVDGEIQSNVGELGQIMQADGSFINSEPEPRKPVYQKPLSEEIADLKQSIAELTIILGGISQ